MRNYQEDIPPWKKEVLMRRDGLSRAMVVETEASPNQDEKPDISKTKASSAEGHVRYKIGTSSSFISRVKSIFSDGKNSILPNINQENNNEGKLFSQMNYNYPCVINNIYTVHPINYFMSTTDIPPRPVMSKSKIS